MNRTRLGFGCRTIRFRSSFTVVARRYGTPSNGENVSFPYMSGVSVMAYRQVISFFVFELFAIEFSAFNLSGRQSLGFYDDNDNLEFLRERRKVNTQCQIFGIMSLLF